MKNIYYYRHIKGFLFNDLLRGRCGRDCMVVAFTNTCAITSPRNENLNLLDQIKFLHLFLYTHVHSSK